jgi:hypothetical protein
MLALVKFDVQPLATVQTEMLPGLKLSSPMLATAILPVRELELAASAGWPYGSLIVATLAPHICGPWKMITVWVLPSGSIKLPLPSTAIWFGYETPDRLQIGGLFFSLLAA